MKKSILLLAMVVYVTATHAQKIQEKDVPSNVKIVLQKQFPDVKDVKWEKEDGNYEATFKHNATGYSVLFNPSGSITETEMEINADDLATSIKSYLLKHYPNKKIKEAAKITDAKGVVTYEAEVNGKDLIFDNAGKFLKEVKD